jgi:lysophospholipase L1-like esterase
MRKAFWGITGVLLVIVLVLTVMVLQRDGLPQDPEAPPPTGSRCISAFSAELTALIYETLETYQLPCRHFRWLNRPGGEFYNRIRLNNFGFHGPDYTYEKPANTFRILIVGDSFPQGIQVPLEEGFPALLEQRLNEQVSIPSVDQIEIINFAIDSYGTDRELLLYALLGWRFAPDLVLLSVYMGNDVKDNYLPFNELNDGMALQQASFSLSETGALLLHDMPEIDAGEFPDSPVWAWLAQQATTSTPRPDWPVPPAPEVLQTDPYRLAYPVDLGVYLPPDEHWNMAWDLTETLILTFADLVESQGVPFGILLIPDRRAVHAEDWSRTQELYPQVQGISALGPVQQIKAFLDTTDIPYLDLMPSLRNWVSASPQDRLYYPNDGHFTAIGHHVTAQWLSVWLQDQGWLTP